MREGGFLTCVKECPSKCKDPAMKKCLVCSKNSKMVSVGRMYQQESVRVGERRGRKGPCQVEFCGPWMYIFGVSRTAMGWVGSGLNGACHELTYIVRPGYR